MTIFCGRQLLALLLMLTFAQTTIGGWWRDRLFNDCLRPAAEYLAGWQLDAEVRMTGLDLSSNRLSISGLHIEQAGVYRIAVAKTEIGFTLGGLWHRQLATVHLQSPRVVIFGLPSSESRGFSAFPEHPPLEIADLKISDGDLVVRLGDIRQELHSLKIDLQGTRRPRFEASARLGDGAGLPIALSGTGNWDQLPGITLTRFDWDGASLLEAPLQFQLASSGASITGKARLPHLNRAELERVLTILALAIDLPPDLDFSFQSPDIALAINPAELEVQLTIPAARLRRGNHPWDFGALTVELHRRDAAWTGTGRFTLEKSVQSTFRFAYLDLQLTGDFTCVVSDFGTLAGRLAPEWKEQLRGGGMLKGKVSSTNDRTQVVADFSGRRAPASGTDFRLDLTPLQAHLTAEITASQIKGQGNILLAGRELASLSGTPNNLKIVLHPISLAEIAPLAGPALLPPFISDIEKAAGSAELRSDPHGRWQGQAEMRIASLKGDGLEIAELAVAGRFRQQQRGISFDDLQLAGRAGMAGGKGRLALRASGAVAGETFQIKLSALDVTEVEFFSNDGASGLTDGHLSAGGQISGNLANRLLGLNLVARFGAGEVLHGPFYANLAGTEARLDLQGGLDLDARQLTARALAIEIPDLVSAQIAGLVSPDLIDLNGSLETGELGALYAQFLEGSAETLAPSLENLELAGTLAADFALRRSPGAMQVRGTLRPREFGLQLASSGVEITGGNGLLPLVFSQGTITTPPEEAQAGSLNFSSFKTGPARLENAPIHLLSTPNRLEIREFPRWHLAGGQIRVNDLVAAIEEGQPTLAARIQVEDIDLKTLSSDLDLIAMTGTLSADLGEIDYTKKTLSSAGRATISAFGGTTVISNIRLRDPVSRYRTLHGDIDFSGIDLHQLTRTFEFGEMNGILDGFIHHLRLFGTVPSQFEAELATREEGRRNISVKALNNLSILSQGGLSAALSRGIYRFIDFYRYQKIGLRCNLDNDVFRLQGTAREGSDDYLVYGGLLPPKIDIIAPERDISFKEMLKRLGRLDRAGR
jgi:hypothetical protein